MLLDRSDSGCGPGTAVAHAGASSIVEVRRQAFEVVRFVPASNCERFRRTGAGAAG